MRLALLADQQDAELLHHLKNGSTTLLVVPDVDTLCRTEADAYIDLLFEDHKDDLDQFQTIFPAPVLVNSVTATVPEGFIRINGWKTFLERNALEAVCQPHSQDEVRHIASALNKNVHFVPDIPGMIAPRVVSMIVNEAFFAYGENVSTPDEIDTAMKLGTNYPYGPFEWSRKIGIHRILQLLTQLAQLDERYLPAPALTAACTEKQH